MWSNKLQPALGDLSTKVNDLTTNVGNWFSDLWNNHLQPTLQDMGNSISTGFSNVGTWLSDMWTNHLYPALQNMGTAIGDGFTAVGGFFKDLWQEHLKPAFADIGDWFSNLGINIGDFFGSLWTNISDFFKGIPEFFKNFWSDIKDFFKSIFVPDEEHITILRDSFLSKFSFIDTIKNGISSLKDIINNVGQAPRIQLTLGATNHSAELKNFSVIDMSFYKPYKKYGDTVITAIFYAFYLWRLFAKLPVIINGTGSGIASIERSKESEGKK